MGSRLVDNITSKYIEAANQLTSKSARRRIVAYVESYDDVYFWRTILSQFEDETRYFEVMLPTRDNTLERGKKAAITNMKKGLGKDMIACVDADYDYLKSGYTQSSREMLDSPYIFHTYVYAIENFQCYAPSLHNVCVAVTLNDSLDFDFVDYFSRFSKIIYPLFVWNISLACSSYFNAFTMSDFNSVIEMRHLHNKNPWSLLDRLEEKVRARVHVLEQNYPDVAGQWKLTEERLRNLGVSPENTYLYIQGHHLFDKFTSPLLNKICSHLVEQRLREIDEQSIHSAQKETEMTCYENSVLPIKAMLKKNLGFVFAPQYKQIVSDLAKYIEETS